MSVGALPPMGRPAANVTFSPRSIAQVKFTVTAVTAGSWAAVGLAEFEGDGRRDARRGATR